MDPVVRRPNPHEERINVPANPQHYWKYRMHLRLEDLLNNEGITKKLLSQVTASGRA
jgi:4-alpha-glucanotransferase